MERDPDIERTAAATTQLYDVLDNRISTLSQAFDKFRDELRTDLRDVELATRGVERAVERIHGENVADQVRDLRRQVESIGERMRKCEAFQANLMGRLLVVVSILGTVIAIGGNIVARLIV